MGVIAFQTGSASDIERNVPILKSKKICLCLGVDCRTIVYRTAFLQGRRSAITIGGLICRSISGVPEHCVGQGSGLPSAHTQSTSP